jgi:PAS domain S-box-containing protein
MTAENGLIVKRTSIEIKYSLRAKLTLLIEGCVIVLVLFTGIITTMREKRTLEGELSKRGLSLVSDVAKFIERPFLEGDLPELRRFVNSSMEHEYALYVLVLDDVGNVVMHSDLSEVGKTYSDSLTMVALESGTPGYTGRHVSEDEELHFDMYAPIQVSGIRLGTVRLGYSRMAIEQEMSNALKQIVAIGLITTIIGGIAAYIIATLIAGPIKKITYATENVAKGRLDTKLTLERSDEIGVLASAFNKMTEDLQRTTVSKDYVDSIIRSMNDTLIVVGPDGVIRSVNKASCELLGYDERGLVGKEISRIMPDEVNIFSNAGSPGLSDEIAVVNQEMDYITKDGKRIPMLFSAAMLKNKEGREEGAVYIARDITKRKQAEEALRDSERKLNLLSSQLLTAQEKERRRLSNELHDELGQSLVVFKLRLRSIYERLGTDQVELKAKIDELMDYAGEVSENVRRLSRDLSPSILKDLGLEAAIRWLVGNFSKHSDSAYSIDMAEIEDMFSEEGQITIYRIIQECLSNITKHAQATQVSIFIRKEAGRTIFRVEDNGEGFDVQEAISKDPGEKGLGLNTMSQRARMLGGSLDIWSQKGVGTRITLAVPFASSEIRVTDSMPE